MMMRHKVAGAGIGALLLFAGADGPVGAQADPAPEATEDEGSEGFDDWGLIGLLGLAGLAGLAKKRDTHDTVTRRPGTGTGSDAGR